MKFTKSQLKELIREQVRGVIEEDDDEWFELGGERERPPMEGQLTASLVDRYGSDEQFKAALDDVLGPPGSGEDIWETIDKFTKFMEEYIPNPNVESGEEEPIEEKKKKKGKDTWMQDLDPKHKGYCTPMTKKTCTPKRKALAKRFKKAARKKKKEGGTGWQGKV